MDGGMRRFVVSLVLGLALGLLMGLVIGWQVAPVEYTDSPLAALSQRYRDEYTVMVAAGYLVDGDRVGAVERLRVLDEDNVPEYVQRTAERFISTSRPIDDVRLLVALAEGLGRLTPLMENFRLLTPPDQSRP